MVRINLLTGRKPGNKAKQNKEGRKNKKSHDYLKRASFEIKRSTTR